MFSLVDDIDFERLNKFKWYANKGGKNFYAMRNYRVKDTRKRKTIRMHTAILKPLFGQEIDHIDGNGLNNQRKNLRTCTKSQNAMNVGLRIDNKSGCKGVSFDAGTKKWRVQISIDKKQRYIGIFATKLEAYEKYCATCDKFHGDFAKK